MIPVPLDEFELHIPELLLRQGWQWLEKHGLEWEQTAPGRYRTFFLQEGELETWIQLEAGRIIQTSCGCRTGPVPAWCMHQAALLLRLQTVGPDTGIPSPVRKKKKSGSGPGPKLSARPRYHREEEMEALLKQLTEEEIRSRLMQVAIQSARWRFEMYLQHPFPLIGQEEERFPDCMKDMLTERFGRRKILPPPEVKELSRMLSSWAAGACKIFEKGHAEKAISVVLALLQVRITHPLIRYNIPAGEEGPAGVALELISRHYRETGQEQWYRQVASLFMAGNPDQPKPLDTLLKSWLKAHALTAEARAVLLQTLSERASVPAISGSISQEEAQNEVWQLLHQWKGPEAAAAYEKKYPRNFLFLVRRTEAFQTAGQPEAVLENVLKLIDMPSASHSNAGRDLMDLGIEAALTLKQAVPAAQLIVHQFPYRAMELPARLRQLFEFFPEELKFSFADTLKSKGVKNSFFHQTVADISLAAAEAGLNALIRMAHHQPATMYKLWKEDKSLFQAFPGVQQAQLLHILYGKTDWINPREEAMAELEEALRELGPAQPANHFVATGRSTDSRLKEALEKLNAMQKRREGK